MNAWSMLGAPGLLRPRGQGSGGTNHPQLGKVTIGHLIGGFLKLDSDELKPMSVSLGAPSPSNAFRNVAMESQSGSNAGVPNQVNHSTEGTGNNNNLFLQFTARTG